MRAKRAQTVVNDLVFIVGNDKDKVAFFGMQNIFNIFDFIFRQEFIESRGRAAVVFL